MNKSYIWPMKLQTVGLIASLWLSCIGCEQRELSQLDNNKVNAILANVNEDDPQFVQKDVSFDSIVTTAGYRDINGESERIKMRLYYYGALTRGYFNLADRDDKNLQVFGKNVDGIWAIKCVTKLNMEEVGGYMLWKSYGDGIWANGHHNFKKQALSLKKQELDYDVLKTW